MEASFYSETSEDEGVQQLQPRFLNRERQTTQEASRNSGFDSSIKNILPSKSNTRIKVKQTLRQSLDRKTPISPVRRMMAQQFGSTSLKKLKNQTQFSRQPPQLTQHVLKSRELSIFEQMQPYFPKPKKLFKKKRVTPSNSVDLPKLKISQIVK